MQLAAAIAATGTVAASPPASRVASSRSDSTDAHALRAAEATGAKPAGASAAAAAKPGSVAASSCGQPGSGSVTFPASSDLPSGVVAVHAPLRGAVASRGSSRRSASGRQQAAPIGSIKPSMLAAIAGLINSALDARGTGPARRPGDCGRAQWERVSDWLLGKMLSKVLLPFLTKWAFFF